MKIKKKILITIILILSPGLFAQEVQILEFNNKPIVDVLIVLGDLSGKNLIPDESVIGKCSYYFTTEDMDEALDLFLKSQNLYISKLDRAYQVSKIYTEIDEDSNITINCTDTDIKLVLDRLTSITGKTILYDNLPRSSITLNIKKLKLPIILEIIMKKFSDYIVDENKDYFYIKRNIIINNPADPKNSAKTNGITISKDGKYSISLNKSRFTQVIKELFNKAEVEYSILGRNDNIIDRLEFKNKTFEELLTLILEGGSCDYVQSNGIYYILDINKTEIANKHIETMIIKLENLNVKELLRLMPGSFMSNNVLKVDEATNSVIVYGTKIKTAPIINFIELIDKDKNLKPRWIKMNFVSSDLFKNTLLKNYPQNSIINVDKNSFLILLTDQQYKSVLELKRTIDIAPESHLITLRYIKSEDLLKNLPKSVTPDNIVATPNPSVIFFYGQNEAYRAFIQELEKIDRPVPQIKYKILVLQNTIGDSSSFGLGVNSHSPDNGDISLPEGEWNAFSGSLGSLLGLNFNVLSAFGPLFSFELNAAIKNNKSKILVDTTLRGLSGEKVTFRNTTTSRFYQTTTDSDGNTEQVGATQEVSWGIILDIEGWSSGDGMVTINIQATISDETKVTGDSSGIPSTSEKVVTTEVRTREGIPVVIGGLLSSKKEISKEKTPILGDIPILGLLFTKDVETETQSEFTIYLIPYIEDVSTININRKIENAYREIAIQW